MRFQKELKQFQYKIGRETTLIYRHSESFLRHVTLTKLRNLVRVQMEMYRRKDVVEAYPYEIILDITNLCNLKCPLCVTGQRLNQRPFGQMRFEDFRRVIDELAPYLFKVRLHSWGEPLLHERVYDMLEYLKTRNIGSEVSSNFTAFRRQDAPLMIESGLELIIISMDGATEEVYQKYRVGGNFQRVLENIRTLAQEKKNRGTRYPLIEIQFLLMRHNIHQREAIKKLAKELGVNRVRPFPVAVNVLDESQRVEWLPEDNRFSRYYPVTFEDKYFSARRVCPWLWRSAVINWDGTVSPCCVYEGPKSDLGKDVFTVGFKSVWNSPPYRAARGAFSNKKGGRSEQNHFTICQYCKGMPKGIDPKQQGIH